MPDLSLPALAERLGLTSEDIQPNAGVIAYAPWDNTNTIQKNPEFYNPDAAKIAKDCTPELDFIHYAGPHMPPLFIWHNRYDIFVPAINPVMIEYGLPFELHIFQGGEHGMSVCNNLLVIIPQQLVLNFPHRLVGGGEQICPHPGKIDAGLVDVAFRHRDGDYPLEMGTFGICPGCWAIYIETRRKLLRSLWRKTGEKTKKRGLLPGKTRRETPL